MQTLPLGLSGRTTTQLGFGCSSIMGSLNRSQSLALLESAFDAGIRHFDTAPLYGYGEAEACLGEFLSRHPGQLTVTTKFGIPATPAKPYIRLARTVASSVFAALPGLRRRLQGTPVPPSTAPRPAPTRNPIFTAANARASLDHSLTALRTSRIDVYLLHEANAIDLDGDNPQSDPLLRLLEDSVTQGKIGTFGVGSDRASIPDLLTHNPVFCPVTQYEWSALNPTVPPGPAFRIHHRALSASFQSIVDLLKREPARAQSWSSEVGQDLSQPKTLARLMLKASLVANPASVILFSSKHPRHIQANVATAADASLAGPASRLHQLFQQEPPSFA